MAKVIIFGLKDNAQLAHYYLLHDSEHEVVAFSVTAEFKPKVHTFNKLPIVQFENIEKKYPPSEFKFFAPMTYRKMNSVRSSIYEQIKKKGYSLISYINSTTTIAQNSDVGENCFILENNTIQPFVKIKNNVVIWVGNYIGHHCVVKNHTFLASHVVLSGNCTVEPYCFFGVNSTVRDNLSIAKGTLVGMSACLTENTEPWGTYLGIPAKRIQTNSLELSLLRDGLF